MSEHGDIIPEDHWFNFSDVPKILVIGDHGCGKTSFINLLLNRKVTNPTRSVETFDLSKVSFFDLQIVDTPGLDIPRWIDVSEDSPNFRKLVKNCLYLICLIDIHYQLPGTIVPLTEFINLTVKLEPSVNITIIHHKHDLLYMNSYEESLSHIKTCVDSCLHIPSQKSREILYICTSTTDLSITINFTHILSPHVRVHQDLKKLLTEFITRSNLEKGFILDKFTKTLILSEPSNFIIKDCEMCCRIIGVTESVSNAVDWTKNGPSTLSSNFQFNHCVMCYRELSPNLVLMYQTNMYKEGSYEHNFNCLKELVGQLLKCFNVYGGSIMTEKHSL